ncbi:hypothetical protein [Burkholderia sp. LMG 32019]|uniref:hypothetical protein n=1 Tax=Burkholderia sp. LMG 32019 TaxID=3158173 RepID=UPI003C2DB002
MQNTVRLSISVLALMLTAPAFANTPADNIAWSAKPVQTVASSSACSAYSGRVMSSGQSLATGSGLEALGASLANAALGAALGAVVGRYQGAAPNPCPRPGL